MYRIQLEFGVLFEKEDIFIEDQFCVRRCYCFEKKMLFSAL